MMDEGKHQTAEQLGGPQSSLEERQGTPESRGRGPGDTATLESPKMVAAQ